MFDIDSPKKKKGKEYEYEEIISTEDSEMLTTLQHLYDEGGYEEVLTYLKQWHYPREHMVSEEKPKQVLLEMDNYILYGSFSQDFIGLCFRKEKE